MTAPMPPSMPRSCMIRPALADEAERIVVVDRVRGDGGGVLAGRMTGERLRRDLDAGLQRLLAHRLQEGEARGEDGGLGVDGQVELLGRTLEDHLGQRDAERLVGALDRPPRRRVSASTRSAPIPTYWEPCPGKTKATVRRRGRQRRRASAWSYRSSNRLPAGRCAGV